jgi:hypothetical protein
MRVLTFSATLFCIACLGASAVAEDVDRAVALFAEGRAALDRDDVKGAYTKFSEAARLAPKAGGILLNLALVEERLGKSAAAFEHFTQAVDLVDDEARRQLAREHAQALRGRVASLRVEVDPQAPQGTRVQLDGAEVSRESLGRDVTLSAGEHVIDVSAPDRSIRHITVNLTGGESKSLYVAPGAAEAASSSSSSSSSSARKALTVVAFGVGAVGTGLGVATGIAALNDKRTVDEQCHGTSVCDSPAGVNAAADGRVVSALSTVGFIVGALGIGAGFALLFTNKPASHTTLSVAPGSAWLRGTF